MKKILVRKLVLLSVVMTSGLSLSAGEFLLPEYDLGTTVQTYEDKNEFRKEVVDFRDVLAEVDRTEENSYEEIPLWATIALVKEGMLTEQASEYLPYVSDEWSERIKSGEFYELTVRDFDINPRKMRLAFNENYGSKAQTVQVQAIFGVRFKAAKKNDDGQLEASLKEGTHNHYVFVYYNEVDGELVAEVSIARKSSAHSYDLGRFVKLESFGYGVGKALSYLNKDWQWTSKYSFEDTFALAEPILKAYFNKPEVRQSLESKIYQNQVPQKQ